MVSKTGLYLLLISYAIGIGFIIFLHMEINKLTKNQVVEIRDSYTGLLTELAEDGERIIIMK